MTLIVVKKPSELSAATAKALAAKVTGVKNAEHYGFLTTATAAANVTALQAAILGGATTLWIKKGVYEVNAPVYVDDYTTIFMEPGVKLSKIGNFHQVFLNKGALTKTYNYGITITGLEIQSNGMQSSIGDIPGMNAHLGFYKIKGLKINDFKMLDGEASNFCISICDWEDIHFNGINITSKKDAFAFQRGNFGLIENCILETGDDAIGLKAADWKGYCTEVGDIYNLTFRNITDRPHPTVSSTGNGCRAVTGSWADWTSGNTYKIGNFCLNAGHLYQCYNANSFSGTGTVAPVHTSGSVTGADGLIWLYLQDTAVYKADVYDITFDNCKQTTERSFLNSSLAYSATYSVPAYAGTEALSTVSNIKIVNSNIKYTGTINLIVSDGNLTSIKIANNKIQKPTSIYVNTQTLVFDRYLTILLTGNELKDTGRYLFYSSHNGERIYVQSSGNWHNSTTEGYTSNSSGNRTMRVNGTDLIFEYQAEYQFAPVLGDMIREASGIYIKKAASWVNIAV